MPDTIRTDAYLLASVFQDGQSAGSISEQDLRDLVVSKSNVATTPSIEELETRVLLPTSIAATTTVYIGPTNFIQRVGAVSFSFTAAIATDTSNWWRAELFRVRANGTPVSLATLTTFSGSGLAIEALTDWNFDAVSWTDANRYLLKGDILYFTFTKTGTPAALANGCAAIRYEPHVTAP